MLGHKAEKGGILAVLAVLLLPAPVWAEGLGASDAGYYALITPDGRQSPSQMHYYLKNGQWVMDGKLKNGGWYEVCGGTGECRLRPSSKEDMRSWQAELPDDARPLPFACINNIAFAFCRSGTAESPAYWWFTFKTPEVPRQYVFRLKRLD
ncbi:MAG: hypothetical protein Q3966_00915 [Neisseria sp.]|nr:hypothetical protein [Neisseria sp.]